MKVLFVEYPKCSTCKKAGKWLQEHGVGYDDRHIVEQNPTAEELKEWHEKSGLPLKRFFNTSGQVYRNNGIKDKLPGMSEKEQYALLATDGMLVKRPIVVGEDFVLVGFKDKEWEEKKLRKAEYEAGKSDGIEIAEERMIHNMIKLDFPIEKIAEVTGKSPLEIEQYLQSNRQ